MKMSYDVQVEELGANRRGLVTSVEPTCALSTMMRLKLKEELL